MFKVIDRFIDSVTMYRLLIYYLIGLLVTAVILSLSGVLHYSAAAIVLSSLILVISCVLVNKVFAAIFDAPVNVESAYITALILALIVTPADSHTLASLTFLLAVSGLSMASKYILTIRRKHIFNPAAVAVVLTALGPHQSASWWVGTAWLLPFVIIGGLMLVRKIHKARMVTIFLASTTVSTIFLALVSKVGVSQSLRDMIFSSAVFFLGFVMLSEPLTSPKTVNKQLWYGAIVGALLPPQVHLLGYYSSPEVALLIGNLFSYIGSPKTKLFPELVQKLRISANAVDFVFNPGVRSFSYQPGQYMEWTLPHTKTDSRGNRRYFTLASSPTEPNLRIGVKFSSSGSSFKQALIGINRDSIVAADQVAGNFVLPKDPAQKLVFIAGGIGITPFRSMIRYLMDTNDNRDIILLYSAKSEEDLAYAELFEQARQKLGITTVYCLTGLKDPAARRPNVHYGRIDEQLISTLVADYLDRKYYISGATSLVKELRRHLKSLGIHRSQIKHDDFSGYN